MPALITNRVALGKQSTFGGAAVARTVLLRGVTSATLSVDHEDSVVVESGTTGIGTFAVPTPRTFSGRLEMAASYQHILYPLCGLFGTPTPTGSGPYAWTFAVPHDAMPTPQVYTAEMGVESYVREVPGFLFGSLTLSGEAGQGVAASSDIMARDLASGTVTPTALPVSAVQSIPMVDAALFIDVTSAFGTTAVNATLVSFELELNPNRHLKVFEGDRAQSFGDGQFEANLSLTLEFGATSNALLQSLLAGVTQRRIRLRFQRGSGTGLRSLVIDYAGIVSDALELYSDRDGNATVEFSFSSIYDPAITSGCRIVVTNELNTLP